MKYRRLGGSGLKVSEISLGSWLTYGGYVERDNAVQAIETAYGLGVNFLIQLMYMKKVRPRRSLARRCADFPANPMSWPPRCTALWATVQMTGAVPQAYYGAVPCQPEAAGC